MTPEAERACVRRWTETGRVLEARRWAELPTLDDASAIRASDALIEAALRVVGQFENKRLGLHCEPWDNAVMGGRSANKTPPEKKTRSSRSDFAAIARQVVERAIGGPLSRDSNLQKVPPRKSQG